MFVCLYNFFFNHLCKYCKNYPNDESIIVFVQKCLKTKLSNLYCIAGSLVKEPPVTVLSSDENLALAVTIPVIVLLLLFVGCLAVFFYKQIQPRGGEIKKVLVDNESMEPGSQAAASSSAPGEGHVTFSKFKARFTKAKPSLQNGSKESSTPSADKGVSNPNYDNMPDYANMGDITIENQSGGESGI